MQERILDICPKCGGNMDMERILDNAREEWVCQLCGGVKRTVKWLSKSEYEIEKEEECKLAIGEALVKCPECGDEMIIDHNMYEVFGLPKCKKCNIEMKSDRF